MYNIVRKFAGVGYDLWLLSDNFTTYAYSKKGKLQFKQFTRLLDFVFSYTTFRFIFSYSFSVTTNNYLPTEMNERFEISLCANDW